MRWRTTVGATLIVGLAAVVAAAAMVTLLRRSLTDDTRLAAQTRAHEFADRLDAQATPTRIETVGDDEYVQVLDVQGEVVGSSDNVAGRPPLADPDPGESAQHDVPFDDDPFLTVALSLAGPEAPSVILVGRSLDNVVESVAAVMQLLAVGIPLMLAFVAFVTWRVVGRALAPVESIRSEVERISMEDLQRRVPEPKTDDEIARLADTMNRMLGRLEEGRTRHRRFVSDASHELRSPVASIRQLAEVAVAHPSQTSTRDLAAHVLAENLRLQGLVEDLLLLARMDEGATEGNERAVDLDDLVLDELDRLRGLGKKLDASGVSAGRVLGDPKHLSRLIANLLDNAQRHSRNKVEVRLFSEDGEVVLQVEDDGPGVPPDERERIFERFVRLEQARDRDSGGAGLGLAIVASVAARHEGIVTISESRLGGARFEVRIPQHPG